MYDNKISSVGSKYYQRQLHPKLSSTFQNTIKIKF